MSRHDNQEASGLDMALLFSMPLIITVLTGIIWYLGMPS